jgi:hypothetical protein
MKRFIFLMAAILLSVSIFALTDSNAAKLKVEPRQKPAIPTEFASMAPDGIYYFYNVGSKLLFTQGNSYGTQASIGERGLKVKIEAQGEGIYTLLDYVKTQGAWKWWWFVEDSNIMYVDYNNQSDFLWEIKYMGDNVYRLSPSELNPSVNDNTKFVGVRWTEDPTNTILYSDCTKDDGSFIDWKLIPEAAGDAYEVAMDVYEASLVLKEQLDKAEEIGANVDNQIAVYNNTSSTVEELNAATEAVKKAIIAREEELAAENYDKATVDNPVNVTKLFIKNPTFEGNDLSGWSGNGWGAYLPKENAERYNTNYNTYQDLSGLLEGVYRFKANGFYRAGEPQPAYNNYKAQNEESKYAKIYATAGGETIEASVMSPYTAGLTKKMTTGNWTSATDEQTNEVFYIPHDMIAADEFLQAGYCNDNYVYIAVSDGNMRVGVKKEQLITDDWSIFDDFTLVYYGNSDEAYKLILNDVIANLPVLNLSGAVYTTSYYEAYNAAVAALKASTSKNQILSNIQAVKDAQTALEKSIELWKEFVALQAEAEACASDENLEPAYLTDISKWASLDSKELLQNHSLTNDELEAEITRVKAMIQEAYKHPYNGTDVTRTFLVNPDFEMSGNTGWTVEKAAGGNVARGGNNNNHCYEAWNNGGFDIYQIVDNAPKGVYEISVQGFYRYGRGNYTAYLNKQTYTTKETCPVFIYLNSNSTPFTNVYDDPVQISDPNFYGSGYESHTLSDGTILYFPNSMDNAAVAFSNGMFTQSSYGLVAQDGDPIRIGVKGNTSQAGDSWCIWDNFKLIFRGFQADVVRPVLEQAIIDGENALNSPIGKDVVASLQASIAEAKTVVNGSNGEAMFNALTKLYDLQETINASKALFAQLKQANEKLASAIPNSTAPTDIINEASNLYNTINSGIEAHRFADSEVEGLINEINKTINRLGMPQDMETASDANPIECTGMIINPAYAEANDNGWTGGAAIDASCTAEKYNTNFDYYQLLQGLPEGTYKLSVQGFYRAGTPDGDYTLWSNDPNSDNNAILYAATDDHSVDTPLQRLASGAQPMDELLSDWAWADNSKGLAVPNRMWTAADAFKTVGNNGAKLFSNNSIIVKVGPEGRLTIGLKKDVQISADWTIWTNWQLFYYGKNSSLEEGPVKKLIWGDANDDGETDISDVICIVNYILDRPLNKFVFSNADTNKDHEILLNDAINIVSFILGKE